MPVATPVWLNGTAWTMRLPSAANARPIPIPSSDAEISMSYGWAWATESHANATPVIALPAIRAGFEPNRWATRPANVPSRAIPTADGSRYRLESTTDAPNPNPVLFGSCANCG